MISRTSSNHDTHTTANKHLRNLKNGDDIRMPSAESKHSHRVVGVPWRRGGGARVIIKNIQGREREREREGKKERKKETESEAYKLMNGEEEEEFDYISITYTSKKNQANNNDKNGHFVFYLRT